jgi:hypothetical protein
MRVLPPKTPPQMSTYDTINRSYLVEVDGPGGNGPRVFGPFTSSVLQGASE